MDLRTLVTAWNEFCFRPQPVIGLALFRVAWGLLLLANLGILSLDVLTWFGESGVLSIVTGGRILAGPRLNLLQVLPAGDAWTLGVFALSVLAAVGLTLGAMTRTSAALVFVGLVSLHHRTPLILNGGDTLLRVVTFLLIFSPAGRAFSIDRLWRIFQGRETASAPVAAPWAQRLIQIQIAVMYVATFSWKVQGDAWVDGTAIYYASRLVEFYRFPVPILLDHLWIMQALTWGTLFVEFALGVLVWIRQLRYPVLLAGLLLHLGIEYMMNIPLFEWIAMACLLAFVEPRDARRTLQWIAERLRARREAIPVFYDGECAFCVRVMAVLRVVDPLRRLDLVDFRRASGTERWPDLDASRAAREMLVRLQDGHWLGGFDACRAVLARLPLGVFLSGWLHVPGVPAVGRRVYAGVARNRSRLPGLTCRRDACLVAEASPGRAA